MKKKTSVRAQKKEVETLPPEPSQTKSASRKGRKSEQELARALPPEDVLSENERDFFDSAEDARDDKVENPFVELRNLITGQGIDVKTVLTSDQILHMHKLDMMESLLSEDPEALETLRRFKKTYMTYIINKEGLSRKQFIEALHKGAEKAEQAKERHQLKNIMPAV